MSQHEEPKTPKADDLTKQELEELLYEAEAAAYLTISESTLGRERKRGRIKFYRIAGWRIAYSPKQIQRYLEEYCKPASRPNSTDTQSAAA